MRDGQMLLVRIKRKQMSFSVHLSSVSSNLNYTSKMHLTILFKFLQLFVICSLMDKHVMHGWHVFFSFVLVLQLKLAVSKHVHGTGVLFYFWFWLLIIFGFLLEVDAPIDSLPFNYFPHLSMTVDEQYALMVNIPLKSFFTSHKGLLYASILERNYSQLK